jgi:hypothetical protein
MATQTMKLVNRIKNIDSSYTIEEGLDMRTIIRADGTFTITLPNKGVYVGFELVIANVGAGTITLSAAGTLNAKGTQLTTQWAATTVIVTSISDSGVVSWDAYGELV